MTLSWVGAILACAYLAIQFIYWTSESVGVYLAKIIILVAGLIIQIVAGSLWPSFLWIILLLMNAFMFGTYIDHKMKTTATAQEEISEPTAVKEKNLRCSHCGTPSETNQGNCEQCGARLPE